MLAPADAELVRRDPALPGLATLLNPVAFAAAIGECVRGVESGEITYIRYKPGTSCLVGYRLRTACGAVDVVARVYPLDARDKLAKADVNGRILLAGHGIVVSFFPDDHLLRGLRRLADAVGRAEFLRKLLPQRPDFWEVTLETLRYKPGRRYVGRLMVNDVPRSAIKVYAPSEFGVARMNAKAFESCAAYRVPARLGHSSRHRTLALKWLPGRLFREILSESPLNVDAVRAVGAALAAIHAQNPSRLRSRSRDEEAKSLRPLAEWIGRVCPDHAARVAQLVNRLAGLLERLPCVDRPVHGDFYARQVLIDGAAVGLLDFDEAYRGDPTADLGLFVAHLWWDALRGSAPRERVEVIHAVLLTGYGSVPRHLALYAAVGLLRLAPQPFRDREPNWPGRIAELLDRAEHELCTHVASPVAVAVEGRRA